MGYGSYSLEAHRAITDQRSDLPQGIVFASNDCHPAMNPLGVRHRESRDSAAHPHSVGIVFALDVSGSMGEIPHQLATKTLPTFMESVLTILPDPQLLFLAFGNAWSDRSPLQVGQFESEAHLIDGWLSKIHVEGAGGSLGESYDLAMYFAARHTKMDCLEKRGKKGYFFMTGDEVPFTHASVEKVRGLLGDPLEADIPIHELAAELQRSFHAFFLIPDANRAGQFECGPVWTKLFHERCVVLDRPEDTAVVAALLVGIQEGLLPDLRAIDAQLEGKLGKTGSEKERLLRTVKPFAEALARGPIAAPEPLSRRTDDPGLRG